MRGGSAGASPPQTLELFGIPFLITTTRRASPAQIEEAKRLAAATGQPYVEREAGALGSLLKDGPNGPYHGILVVRKVDYVFRLPNGSELFYHPGMAVHRIKALAAGRGDPMVEAMQLQAGDSVLDATAGLCSDALVASHVVGPTGRVVAVESSLPVALVVQRGLATYASPRRGVEEAMRRITLRPAQASAYLATLAPGSIDVVYFDPMFTEPVHQSTGIAVLRLIADPTPLTVDTLRRAAHVARRAIVVKDRKHGPWFTSELFGRRVAGAGRRVGYGVIEGDELTQLRSGAEGSDAK